MNSGLLSDNQQDQERNLIRRAQRGDEIAFEQLIERFSPLLYRVVRRISSDPLEAEAIVQETFLRLWRNLARYHADRPFLPYLVTIAMNIGRDLWRKDRFLDFSGLQAVEERISSAEISPEEQAANSELLERLAAAVASLPTAYRAVIAMRYDAEMSYQDIAQALGLPVNTVRTHIHRAKAALRQALGPKENGDG